MDYFLTILGIFVSILLILVILLQRGRGGGLVGALSGLGGQSAFGTKAGDTFTRITIGIAAVWVVLAGITGQVFRSSTNLFRGDDPVSIQSKTKDTGDRDAKKFGDVKEDSKDADDKELDAKELLKSEEDSTKETKKEVEPPKADKEAKPAEKTKSDDAESKEQDSPKKDSGAKDDEKTKKPESADEPTDSK